MKAGLLQDQRGQSMLELAVVLPTLLFLVMCVVETGRAMNQYLQLSHIVYEGARYGASLAGLEPGENGGEAGTNQMHDRVRSRVRSLLDYSEFPEEGPVITSRYHDVNASGGGVAPNSVTVSVELAFQPLFPILQGLAIRAEATAPYLFKDENL